MLRFVSYQILSSVKSHSSSTVAPAATHVGVFFPSEKGGQLVNLQQIPGVSHEMDKQSFKTLDMNAFIAHHHHFMPYLHRWMKNPVNREDFLSKHGFSLADRDVKLLAPIPLPHRNVICVGKNYYDHIAEVAKADKTAGIGTTSSPAAELPKYPQFFTKAPHSVIGPDDIIENHLNVTKWLDYELELAVIVGKKGRDIPKDRVKEHVFGYTVGNDVCARDIQRRHNQWFKGKTLDTTCPLGPSILYRGDPAIEGSTIDPQNLSLSLSVNDEVRQKSNTKNMIFPIDEIIHQLSQGFTLYPGDVILTGTPDGVGYAMKPPRTLQPGDRLRLEIEHVGVLENSVQK